MRWLREKNHRCLRKNWKSLFMRLEYEIANCDGYKCLGLRHSLEGRPFSTCTVVYVDQVVKGVCSDADDEKFLSCALAANVEAGADYRRFPNIYFLHTSA